MMQARNRRKEVMDRLKQQKTVYVKELADSLEVSDMTIRRDLHRLADLGMVTLIHGGAVLNEGTATLDSVRARASRMSKEKSAIAAYCAGLVKEGNAVYLDTGTTVMEIAEALKMRQNIAVLTHSLPICNILANSEKIQLISMPGIYNPTLKGFVGDMTCRMIRSFRIDIAFLGISSIDLDTGIMTPDFRDQAVKIALTERASRKVVACDHSKIGHVSFAQVCPLNAVDMIVTDKMADKDFLRTAGRMGVEVVTVG